MTKADVLIVGTGVSGMATLKSVLSEIITHKSYKPLHIVVAEQQQLWSGIPFGFNLSANCLTITSVYEFLTNPADRTEFTNWITLNKERCLSSYLQQGGYTSQQWLKHNQEHVEQNNWDPIFIPRYWYREYLTESLQELMQIASATGAATFTTFRGEATAVKKKGKGYQVTVTQDAKQQIITADKIILAVGSPPVKPLAINVPSQKFTYINDVYLRKLSESFEIISAAMQAVSDTRKRNLLLVGSNASCTELLYLISHNTELQQLFNQILVLSPSGSLPRPIDTQPTLCPAFENLSLIQAQKAFSSNELIKAAVADIAAISNAGINTKNIEKLVTQAMQLKLRLTAEELEKFETHFGTAVTANIRRMGQDYYRGISQLREDGKLVMLKGKFSSIEDIDNDALVKYINDAGELVTHDAPLAAAINCTGFEPLNQCSSKLINNLLDQGICKANSTQKGFEVNECFEAASNLYVMGPLLAGNNNKNIHYWHVENVARILQLAAIFTPQLLAHYRISRSFIKPVENIKRYIA